MFILFINKLYDIKFLIIYVFLIYIIVNYIYIRELNKIYFIFENN